MIRRNVFLVNKFYWKKFKSLYTPNSDLCDTIEIPISIEFSMHFSKENYDEILLLEGTWEMVLQQKERLAGASYTCYRTIPNCKHTILVSALYL